MASDIAQMFLITIPGLSGVIYSFVVIVLCWINPSLNVFKKILWTILILVTAVFFAVGGVLYGLIYFRKFKKLFPVLILAIEIAYPFYLTSHKDELQDMSANMAVKGTEMSLKRFPDSPNKSKVLNDLQALEQEMVGRNLTPEQLRTDSDLVIYLGTLNDLSDAEYDDWQKLFVNRATLPGSDIEKLLQGRIELSRMKMLDNK